MYREATITICPPGVARGAKAPKLRSRAKAQRNNYGRLQRSQRRDNARPGDVITAMANVLFQKPEVA